MQRYGDGEGVFEAVKVVAGRPFALDRHLDRLLASARSVGLPTIDADAVRLAVEQALTAPVPPLARIRITLSRAGAVSEVAVSLAPLAPAAETAAVVTSPWPRNHGGALVGHKALDYVDEIVALTHARRHGASEAVLADAAGHLCEGTTSNVFYVLDGELRTPSLDTGCLSGISRALVLEWHGAVELAEPLAEVRARASEVFLTSTTRDVQPVVRWDDRNLEPGPVTAAVASEWRRHASIGATNS